MTTSTLVRIPLDQLEPHPDEPPLRLAADDPETHELAQSIGALGQLQPIRVRKVGTKYRIEAGHRRWIAHERLGLPDIEAVVIEGGGGEASLAVLVAENLQRKDLDVMVEAALVSQMLEESDEPATHEAVGLALGKSPKWVARRANLSKLSANWRKARQDPANPVSRWFPSWLEEIAILTPEQQESLAKELGRYTTGDVDSLAGARHLIESRLRKLKAATFDPADELLVPAVGACVTCPKHSLAQNTLFGVDPDADIREATCTDARCFDAKHLAKMQLKLEELREIHGDVALVVGENPAGVRAGKSAELGGTVREAFHYDKSSKVKGGKIALVVDGKGAGRTRWVADKAGAPRVRKTVKEKRADLAGKREEEVCNQVAKAVEAVDFKDLSPKVRETDLLDWVLRASGEYENGWDPDAPTDLLKLRSAEELEKQAWGRIRWNLAGILGGEWSYIRAPGGFRKLSETAAALVGADIKAIRKQVAESMPEPKSWQNDKS